MSRRRWFAPAAALAVPIVTALVAGCPGGGGNPYSPFAVPTVLPSPLLGVGTLSLTFSADSAAFAGETKRFARAVYFAPGGGQVGIRPDRISPEQRQDIFPDEIAVNGLDFRLTFPANEGLLPADGGQATLTVTDTRSEPHETYEGPVTVFLQEGGKRRGFPVLGTVSGTLTSASGRHLTISAGQFHGYLATDL